jgi:hypothetical protein
MATSVGKGNRPLCVPARTAITDRRSYESLFIPFFVAMLLPLLLGGCAQKQGAQGAQETSPPVPLLVKYGSVHGGQQAVSGSTIQLYAVGTTGDGSAATPLLTQAVTTDASGISISRVTIAVRRQPRWYTSSRPGETPVWPQGRTILRWP